MVQNTKGLPAIAPLCGTQARRAGIQSWWSWHRISLSKSRKYLKQFLDCPLSLPVNRYPVLNWSFETRATGFQQQSFSAPEPLPLCNADHNSDRALNHNDAGGRQRFSVTTYPEMWIYIQSEDPWEAAPEDVIIYVVAPDPRKSSPSVAAPAKRASIFISFSIKAASFMFYNPGLGL